MKVRAAVHVHSDWSYDGTWPLREIARAFHRRRYHVVLMSEHDRGFDDERWASYRDACAEASDERLLLVPGIEYSDAENRVHVQVWGEMPFLGEGLETAELLRRVQAFGGVAVLSHPARREVLDRFEPRRSEGLIGSEFWNRRYDGLAPSRDAVRLLERNTSLVPFAALDFHTRRQFLPLAMILDVDGTMTPESVLEALRTKRCRAVAFRLPAVWLAYGPGFLVARGLDWLRRHVARAVRKVEAHRARRTRRG
jgi:hypothetical protein